MNLTQVNFERLRSEMETALAEVAAKYGCEVVAGKIKYDNTVINVDLAFKAKGENGESAEEVEFKKLCGEYGFVPEDYRKAVVIKDKMYRLVGFNTRARKNFCIIKDANGQTYTCAPGVFHGPTFISR